MEKLNRRLLTFQLMKRLQHYTVGFQEMMNFKAKLDILELHRKN